jgi:type II secretory ATPase GspE/PulE/Tfp pilus assembly ATPase PilB-like protein
MEKRVVLKFMDGHEERGILLRPFRPRERQVEAVLEHDGGRHTFPLEELCCLFFTQEGSWSPAPGEDEFHEEIETIHGDSFPVRTFGENSKSEGFFAFPIREDTPYGCIFFARHGIRSRSQRHLLGHILEKKGLVTPSAMEEVLNEQTRLRSRRLGEILAQHNNLTQESVEQSILAAEQEQKLPPNARVGDILIAAGLVTREQVEEAVASQERGRKKRVGTLLVERGLITEDQLLTALATKFRLPFIDLEELVPTDEALGALSRGTVHRLQVLPIEIFGRTLAVATSSPTDPTLGDSLRFISNFNIDFVVARPRQIADSIRKYYGENEESVEELLDEMTGEEIAVESEDEEVPLLKESDSKIITLVNRILVDAYHKGASDIHFEPGMGARELQVRYRIDGLCRPMHRISAGYKPAIVSRVKIMARLDIAERRRPQSGKILLRFGRKRVEYRAEVTPTVGGMEDVVLRVLASSRPLPLKEMGFSGYNLDKFTHMLDQPYGIILCVGPTGSGKTTTLHSALGRINTPDRKIWTVEDPVEITQAGLRQVQVDAKIGFTFQSALRSFLRADPDVIMIGEMRDAETAKTAIGASLTGHLVLSTLHTNSAPETIARLIEIGMDPINFADAMLGILAQRLTRRLCTECRRPYHPDRAAYEQLVEAYGAKWFHAHDMPEYSTDLVLMKKAGCDTCGGTGYRGRLAIQELLVNSDPLRELVKKTARVEVLRAAAIHEGMRTLRMDGVRKIFDGLTDLEQITRVCL